MLEKVIPLPPSLHPHLDWWLDEGNVLKGQPLHPLRHALQLFTDASNKGWGTHLGDSTARGVWSDKESRLHINFLELKEVFLALRSFELLCKNQIVLIAPDNSTVVSYINKQGGMKSGSLFAQGNRPESTTHSRSFESDRGQAIQTQSDNPDRIGSGSASVQSLVLEVGPTTGGSFCNPVQLQAFQVCVTCARSDSLGGGRLESAVADSGCLSLPSRLSSQPGDLKGSGSGLTKDDSHCIRLAKHALVLGSGQSISADSIQPSSTKESSDPAVQQPSSPRSLQSESSCMAPRAFTNKASLEKWQHELRLLRDCQPEQFTNQSGPFLSSGVSRTRWTSGRPL